MSSGSASYSVSATNYGRNANDSYFVLSTPGVQQGNQEITGNLQVDGTTTLTGAVSCGSTLSAVGQLSGASLAVTGAVTCGAVTATGALSAASVTTPGAVTASGAVSGASLATAGAATAASLAVTGAVTGASASVTGALVAAGGYNSVALAAAPLTGSYVALGPTFTRPCIVGVNVSNTITPASPAGNITQNRYFLVRLVFTDTGTNLLTDTILIDSNVGGAGSNINIQWNSAAGRFQFYSNASPIQATAITFAVMNQA